MNIASLRHKLHRLEARDQEVAAAYDASSAAVHMGRKAMAAAIHEKLLEVKSVGQKGFVTLDGLPGTSKTKIATGVQKRGHTLGVVPGDRFLKNPCGSDLWEPVVQSAESFDAGFLHERDAKAVVATGLYALQSGQGSVIPIVDYGKRGFPPHLEIPSNADALIYEGLGADRITSQVEVPEGIVRINGLTRTTTLESLWAATLRDVLNRIHPEKFVPRYMHRLQEAPHLLDWIAAAVQRATDICLRFPMPDSFSMRVGEKFGDPIRDTGMTVRDLFESLPPEFLEVTFPGPLPRQLHAESEQTFVEVA